jgi:hypothetical protein
MRLADDYAGAFDPHWSFERLSRAALARLCREYMLGSMYHDRALMPHVAAAGGRDATIRHADVEWMSSSPVYTERNKRNLRIEGDGVGEAFKSFQFDIGCPHHFLDFRYELVDHDLGFFRLPFCGAHDYVRMISHNDAGLVTDVCHGMEDRTFDATLGVTNPRLRAIPVHRPPKPDEFTGDHCRWEVRVVDDAPGARPSEPTLGTIRATTAATFELAIGESHEPGGLDDYSGDFLPELRLDDLSHAVLVRQAKEFALDVHLLMRAAYLAVDREFGTAVLDDAAPQHRAAIAPVLVQRLRAALRIDGDGIDAIAKLLQLDPFLPNDYVRHHVDVVDTKHARIWFEDSPGLHDDACRSPLSWLQQADAPGFEHMAQAVNPRTRVRPLDAAAIDAGDAVLAWDVVIDEDAEPVAAHWAAGLVGGGPIATIDLSARKAPVAPPPGSPPRGQATARVAKSTTAGLTTSGYSTWG